ncbi:FAD-dependent oxidoreductase [Paludibacterium denitrificans]|uniref:FAD-dependent oxidoreductase n=1 Tax=Paludibacterium denitrificans TaxID=2675226 RepID=UPI001E631D90|nr:FAD-dependent oxidoreductase [Paludibacterium denitrificans]
MKVAVLGAGVVGVSTAWFLAEHGHEVVVVDRASGAGRETSFANGGQISVSQSEPPGQALGTLQGPQVVAQGRCAAVVPFTAGPGAMALGLAVLVGMPP